MAKKHRTSELEKEMVTHSRTLAWKIPWREEHGRLQPMGSPRVGHVGATSLSFFQNKINLSLTCSLPILLFPVSQASLCFFKRRTDFIAPETGKVFFSSYLHIIFIKYRIKLVPQNIVNFIQTAQTWLIGLLTPKSSSENS